MADLIKQTIESSTSVAKFTKLVGAIKNINADKAAEIYELEKFHFMKELQEKGLQDCTPITAMGVFLDVISNGLSFASGSKHVYVMSRNAKVGNPDNPQWEKRMGWTPTPDGKIYLCQRAKSIDHVTKPVMVYEGDEFSIGTTDKGFQYVTHKVQMPRKAGAKLIAGYVYVVLNNGDREAFWMDMTDVERLKGYSARQNKNKGANELYSSNNGMIDTGFFAAKLISHALRPYRKSTIASNYQVEDEAADIIDYETGEVIETSRQIESAAQAPGASKPVDTHSEKPESITEIDPF